MARSQRSGPSSVQQSRFVRSGFARCLLLLGAGPAAAVAQAPEYYLRAGIGAGNAPNGSAGATNVDFDLGRPIGMLGFGLDTGAWRFELDGGYRTNDAEVVFYDDGRADVAPNIDSRITAISLGLNVIRDFELGGLRPYLGIGVGGARIDYELTEYITERPLLDDRDSVFAYQWLAGFELPLTPRLDFTGEYRSWYAPDIDLTDIDGADFSTDHQVRSATVGVRYRFGDGAAPTAGAGPERLEPGTGWYLAAAAGPSFAKDAEIKDNIANFDAFDTGPFVAVGVGYDFAGPWRVEVEMAHRRHEAELVDFNPEFGEDRASGRVRADSLMVNVAYQPRWRLPFQPFAALGAGIAWSDWDVRLDTDRFDPASNVYVDDSDSAAAVQLVLGAAAPLTPRLHAVAEYRYWMTGLFDMAQPDGRELRTEHTVHGVMLGLRYQFR